MRSSTGTCGRLGQLVVGLAASLLVAAACGGGGQAQSGTGGTFTGAFDEGPGGCVECFNPVVATGGFTWLEKYYSTLLLYDVNFQRLQGNLAQSWDVSADGLQYTLHLRKGVTWHDGKPFTSADVKFTIQLVQNPDTTSWMITKFTPIKEVDTPDDSTAVLRLASPDAALLDALTFLVMLPQHALASIAPKDLVKSDWWRTHPVGTGPFKWYKYVPGQYVELAANPSYWGGKPKIDYLIDRYFTEAGSSVIALRKGEIKFDYVTLDDEQNLQGDSSLRIISGPSQVLNYLGMNLKEPRFQDVRVRQAFMYAIDRQSINQQLFRGGANVVPCAYNNQKYVPSGLNTYARDVNKAKQLLQDANWDTLSHGQPIEILTYYTDQLSTNILTTIQQNLAQAGVNVTFRAVDTNTYVAAANAGKFDIDYAGTANGPDPDVVAGSFLSTAPAPNGNNTHGIAIQALDQVLNQGRTQTDASQRATTYQQACKVMNDQLPLQFMWVTTRYGVVSKKVGNFIWTPAPGGGHYVENAQDWTLSS